MLYGQDHDWKPIRKDVKSIAIIVDRDRDTNVYFL